MYDSKEYRAIRKKITKMRERVDELEKESEAILGSQKMKCLCGKVHSIRDVVYIEVIEYHPSYCAYEDATWDPIKHYAHGAAPCCENAFVIDDPGLLQLSSHFGLKASYYGHKANTYKPYYQTGHRWSGGDALRFYDVKDLLNHFRKTRK